MLTKGPTITSLGREFLQFQDDIIGINFEARRGRWKRKMRTTIALNVVGLWIPGQCSETSPYLEAATA